MKELSIEEKAKHYDEAYKRVAVRFGSNVADEIFPELKESEDERIRKAIHIYLDWLDGRKDYAPKGEYSIRDMIAWLEAQGEHANFRNKIQVGDKVTRNQDGVLVNLSQLERVAKPAEKQGKHDMGISEATKQKLEGELHKALEKETPESWNKFLDEQGEQKPAAKYKVGDTVYYDSFGRLVSFAIANIVEDGTGNPMYEDKDGNSIFQNEIVEQKPYGQREECSDCQFNYAGECKGYCAMKRGEQKTTDKVEPKFKVGDWITNGINFTFQVCSIEDNMYLRSDDYFIDIETADKTFRLWTIQDAKPGDVLACLNDAGDRYVVFIFKNINSDEGWVFCFCASDANGCFCTNNDYVGNSNSTNISPATKEQRNLLFQKMHEAGYEWDAWKKELKKIDQKPAETEKEAKGNDRKIPNSAWTEEDKKMSRFIGNAITADDSSMYLKSKGIQVIDAHVWLDELKERVLSQSKQEWSKEDEVLLKFSLENLTELKNRFDEEYGKVGDCINWLKSLKERYTWKPSDEQMKLLREVQQALLGKDCHNRFVNFMYELKRLREE